MSDFDTALRALVRLDEAAWAQGLPTVARPLLRARCP
jgi:hypothetical protein